jgi:hypothetical protein
MEKTMRPATSHCCGYVLRMENRAKRQEIVRLLKLYHQSHGTE